MASLLPRLAGHDASSEVDEATFAAHLHDHTAKVSTKRRFFVLQLANGVYIGGVQLEGPRRVVTALRARAFCSSSSLGSTTPLHHCASMEAFLAAIRGLSVAMERHGGKSSEVVG